MTRNRHITLVGAALAVPVTALAIAGCGSDNSGGDSASASPANGQSAAVDVANNGKLGKILVDSQGRTLYLFEKDTGTTSSCSGACASAWPPYTTSGKATGGPGTTASLVGTTARSGGQRQVTYNGHPLYRYAGDSSAGDTNGQGLDQFGGGWYVLSPAGDQVEGGASGSTGSEYGY
jgi:predicted lipoprotein with Yx(FWY)xxD motif